MAKKLKLYELHDGQKMWVSREIKTGAFKNETELVRHIFSIGMNEYLKEKIAEVKQ